MARLDEIAEGLARVLQVAPAPEPLPVDLVNETPAAATVLVRAVIDCCKRNGTMLSRVGICPVLGAGLLREHGDDGYEGVAIYADVELEGRVAFFRYPAGGARGRT
ncbi:hypothetical protein ACXYL9_03225 [Qipengyuania sp. CAU 1752]